MKPWIDISQPLNENVATWPGDTPFNYQLSWTKAKSGSVNVGQITMSTHTGTHIDAPYHFDDKGKKVHELDINLYIGRARVIHIPNVDQIGPEQLGEVDLSDVTRLLIRTDAWKDRHSFPTEIPPVNQELALYLKEKGVRLIGLDLPSVDPLDSKELLAHHALADHGIHIVEGLVLDDIAPGEYDFIALPLPLTDGDGSPVRAVLREIVR